MSVWNNRIKPSTPLTSGWPIHDWVKLPFPIKLTGPPLLVTPVWTMWWCLTQWCLVWWESLNRRLKLTDYFFFIFFSLGVPLWMEINPYLTQERTYKHYGPTINWTCGSEFHNKAHWQGDFIYLAHLIRIKQEQVIYRFI